MLYADAGEQNCHIRRVPYPIAVPKAMGSNMDAAGCSKTTLGMVIEGIYVVIFLLSFVI
jgi:hypothetical protein